MKRTKTTYAYCDYCYREIGDWDWVKCRIYRFWNRDACLDCYNAFVEFKNKRMDWGREHANERARV